MTRSDDDMLKGLRRAGDKLADDQALSREELDSVRSLWESVPEELRREDEAVLAAAGRRTVMRRRLAITAPAALVVVSAVLYFVWSPPIPAIVVAQASISAFEDRTKGGGDETPNFLDGTLVWLHLEVAQDGRVLLGHIDRAGKLTPLGRAPEPVRPSSTTLGPWPVEAVGGVEAMIVFSSETSVSPAALGQALDRARAAATATTGWEARVTAMLEAAENDERVAVMVVRFTTVEEP